MKTLYKIITKIESYETQINLTIVFAITFLYIYPELIFNQNITSIIKSLLTGCVIGTIIAKLNDKKIIDGTVIVNCYLGFTLSIALINNFNNVILNIICYIILVICSFRIIDIILKKWKVIIKNIKFIISIIALIISSIALIIQILEYFK
jgi:hypothetical protein